MRERQQKLVITFHTTTEAIAMERACKERKIPGRLIPVPRQISSDCGLAWMMPAEWEEKALRFAADYELSYESAGIYRI